MIALVLAAGLGSRYGGDKQCDAVGPRGEWIMDYNLQDAAAAGFERAVVVCRPEQRQAIARRLDQRAPAGLQVRCLAQMPADLPVARPSRARPWGTGHAVLAARHALDAPFCVLNADDLYGAGSFVVAAALLRELEPGRGGLVSFALGACLSPHGGVSRGVCEIVQGQLRTVAEHRELRQLGQRVLGLDPSGLQVELDPATPVSLNTWCLHPSVLAPLEAAFARWLAAAPADDAEFQLPTALDQLLRSGALRIACRPSPERWHGVTTRADRAAVVAQVGLRA